MTVRATLPFLLIAFAAFALAAPQASAAPILDQSFDANPAGGNFVLGITSAGAVEDLAQTFTAGLTGDLVQVDVQIWNLISFGVPSATGDITLEIQTTSGGAPSGTVLATETIMSVSVPTTGGTVPFTNVVLSAPFGVTAGDILAIVLLYSGPGNYLWRFSGGDLYAPGGIFPRLNAGSWVGPFGDGGFQTWVDVPEPSALLLLSLGALVVLRRRRRA